MIVEMASRHRQGHGPGLLENRKPLGLVCAGVGRTPRPAAGAL